MAKRPFRANRMGALALSLALMTGLGACTPDHTTLDLFDPSDGVRASLEGEINAWNLLILSEEKGAAGTLVGSLTNVTKSPVSVEVLVDGADPILVELDAGHTAYLTPKNPDYAGTSFAFNAQVSTVDVAPGGAIDVLITTATSGSTAVRVPVLDGTLEPYDEYLP